MMKANHTFFRGLVVSIAFVGLACSHSLAEQFEFRFDELSTSSYFDRWMYPFNVTPGTRIQAPTFGALGSEGFDERDGQFVIALNTAELGVATNLPAERYRIDSATLTLTETFGGYVYDPTYDSFVSYLGSTAAIYQADEDDGRPIELYGLGLRGGFTELAWPDGEDSDPPAFGSASTFGGNGKGQRSVYAADAFGTDVSNNVDSLADGVAGFDPVPFAVAMLVNDGVELQAGEVATAGTHWVFEMNVEEPSIQAYMSDAISIGQLGFVVSSLHATGVQGTGDPFPNPATANHFAFDGPVLTLDVEILDAIYGDFDGDALLTAADIDLLSLAVRELSGDARFDLNLDGAIQDTDRVLWVETAGSFFGDSDLNGEVSFSDFLRVSQNFGAHGGWNDGDFDGDGSVGFADFLLLSQNFGQPAAKVANVAEPTLSLPIALLFVLAGLAQIRRTGGI